MTDTFRRILYPTFVCTIIATVWTMGWAKATTDQVQGRRHWPAPHPHLVHFDDAARSTR